MTKELFEKYATLKLEIAKLESEAEELKAQIVPEMPLDTPVELEGFGIFSMVPKKTWKYTDPTESLRSKLKDEEKLEQQTGAATYEEKPYLLFKPNK